MENAHSTKNQFWNLQNESACSSFAGVGRTFWDFSIMRHPDNLRLKKPKMKQNMFVKQIWSTTVAISICSSLFKKFKWLVCKKSVRFRSPTICIDIELALEIHYTEGKGHACFVHQDNSRVQLNVRQAEIVHIYVCVYAHTYPCIT